MNETIGAKGGYNDRRRTKKIIDKVNQKIEEEDLEQLEKEVKKIELKNALVLIPLSITGNIIYLKGKKESPKKVLTESTKPVPNKSITLKEPQKVPIKTLNITEHTEKIIHEQEKKEVTKLPKVEVKRVEQHDIKIPPTIETKETPEPSKTISIENNKYYEKAVVNKYAKKLKEVRKELKQIVFEYNIIAENYENIYNLADLEALLAKLNRLIEKLEELKKKIIFTDSNYKSNYFYEIAQNYIDLLTQDELIAEIKDSPLYLSIEEKIMELDNKKDKLSLNLEERKEKIKIDNNDLDNLKLKYDEYSNFNNMLLQIQEDQNKIIAEMNEKLRNATTEGEKVTIRLKVANRDLKSLLSILALQTIVPGPKSAKKMAVATATSIYFLKSIMRSKYKIEHKKYFQVIDYQKEINNSISELDNATSLINKSASEVNNIINKIKKDYSNYLEDNEELNQLLRNLEHIYSSLQEKEEYLEDMKIIQKQNLEENNKKLTKL